MARSESGKSALIEVKAVDDAYPLYGAVSITKPDDAGLVWRFPGVVLVERALLDRLNLDIGSPLKIGEARVTVGGVLGDQPDRLADRLAYGPKLLMSRETLDRTGLVQPGSLIRWTYRVKLPEARAADRDAIAASRTEIESKFPQAGFAIHDWIDPAPSLRRDAGRFTQFISFVGLTALLLGGIGVGNAIQSYMAKKREIIATFKCLGAPARLVLVVYLIQALLLAAVGIAIGLLIGALAPAAIAAAYADSLPISLAVEPHPMALLTAALAGLLTMVLFVLWPLGRAASVSPAVLMRTHLTEEHERSPWPYAAGSVAAGLALFALAIAASEERAITASISVGIVLAFLLLTGFGLLLQRYAAKFRRAKPPSLALALASISGPGSLARSIAVSLGLGLGLLIAVALIHRSLIAEIDQQYRHRCAGVLLPGRRGRRPGRLQGQGQGHRACRQARRGADAQGPHRGAERRAGGEDRGRARFALGARRRPRPHLYRRRAAVLDHRRGRVVAQRLCRAAAGLVRRRDGQGAGP